MREHYTQHPGEYGPKMAELDLISLMIVTFEILVEMFENITYLIFRTGLRGAPASQS
jgi:hypothetical protein